MALSAQQIEEKLDSCYKFSTDPISIDVAKIIGCGFLPEHCRISFTNSETNKKLAKQLFSDYLQYAVGYRICNVGSETIKGIVVPKFEYNNRTGLYEGVEELVDLPQNGFIDLPTRYIIFLLLSHGQNLMIHNGGFRPMLADDSLYSRDIDMLSNFEFHPDSDWSDYFSDVRSYISIGAEEVSRDDMYLGFNIVPTPVEYRKRFGFLINPEQEKIDKSQEELVKDINYEDISDSIKFLATVLWKKDFK